MPNCFKCGALYGRGDDFCPKCGERLTTRRFNFSILIVIMAVIGIVLFFALKTPKMGPTSSVELPTTMSVAVPFDEEEIRISEEMLRELQSQYESERDLLRERFTLIDSELQSQYESERDLLRERLDSILNKLETYEAGSGLINQAQQEEGKLSELYSEKLDELINQAQQEEGKLSELYSEKLDELINQARHRNTDLIGLYGNISEELLTQAHEANLRLIDLYGEISEKLSTQAHEGNIRLIGSYEKALEEQQSQEKKCEWGYTDEYKCDGKKIHQKWMNSNCSFEWFYYLTCYYGCEDGKCVDKPKCEYGYSDEYTCDSDVLRRKWVNSDCSFEWFYHETCDYGCENGECVDKPVEEQEGCKWGYSGEYKCEGNVIKRKWVNSDCSFEWFYYLTCYYGCENGKCMGQPPQEEVGYIQDQCIYITNFHFNAAGDDNYNLNDEYVTFKNKCSYSIDMTSWTVRDETAYHVYTFPSFTFGSGATFTLYTGTGTNTNSALYWGRTQGDYAAIWNNEGGDTLFLKDLNGNLVLSHSYVGY